MDGLLFDLPSQQENKRVQKREQSVCKKPIEKNEDDELKKTHHNHPEYEWEKQNIMARLKKLDEEGKKKK